MQTELFVITVAAAMANFFLLAIIIIAVILLYKIAVSLYDYYITRRKLSHIPGPAAIPFIGTLETVQQTEEGRLDWLLSLLHRFKNGIFLIWAGSTPLIFLYKPEMLKVVLSSTVHINKSNRYDYFRPWLNNGLLLSEDKQWFRDRKLLSPSLHFNAIEKFSIIMSEKMESMIENLEKEVAKNSGKPINIVSIMYNIALDIVCETLMGISENTEDVKSNYVKGIHRLLRLIKIRLNRPWLSMDWIFNLTDYGSEFKKTIDSLHKFTRNVIRKKQLARSMQNDESQNNHNDFATTARPKGKSILEFLLDINKDKDILSDELLKSQIDTLVFAAYDTSATLMCFTLFCLGNNLEHQEKVHKEIDEVFRDWQGPASTKQLSQLKYLDRVIKETLRLYPSVPLISRKIAQDVDLGGYMIPKDSTITMPILLLHRDPAIWPNPLKFDPDRFLPENMKHMHPYAYIPFSAGPRNCIGQRYGLLKNKIILTAILRNWRIKSVKTMAELNLYDTNVLQPQQGAIYMHFLPKK